MLRLNPVKHGIYSQTPVLPLVEDAEQWERLKNGVFEHLRSRVRSRSRWGC